MIRCFKQRNRPERRKRCVNKQPERRLLGCLGALLGALPAAPLAWLLLRNDIFTSIAGAAGFLLSVSGYRLLAGRSSGLGTTLAAILTPLAALPGLWYAFAEQIFLDNQRFGCTMAEALELVPTVARDPINRGQLLQVLGGLVALDLLCAILFARYLHLRQAEKR